MGVCAFAQMRPMPSRRGDGRQSKIQPGPSTAEPLATFNGVVHEIDSKTLRIDESESNMLEFNCTRKTKYYDGTKQIKSEAIKPGVLVSVETKRAPDGKLDAVIVHLEHEKNPESEKSAN
jgi:hypothetical protein